MQEALDFPSASILQYNCRKSPTVWHTLLNDEEVARFPLLLLQEPAINPHSDLPFHHPRWIALHSPPPPYPEGMEFKHRPKIRSVIMIHSTLGSSSFTHVSTSNPDLSIIKLKLGPKELTLVNIYNPPSTHATLPPLLAYLQDPQQVDLGSPIVVAGDFNLHSSQWNPQGYTEEDADSSDTMEDLSELGFRLLSEPGKPTFYSDAGGRPTTIDLVFANETGEELLVAARTNEQGSLSFGSDHASITIELALEVERMPAPPRYNWRKVDWDAFRTSLDEAIPDTDLPLPLPSKQSIDKGVEDLTNAFVTVRDKLVPVFSPPLYAKRWWSPELTSLKRSLNRAQRRLQGLHREFRQPFDPDLQEALAAFKAVRRLWAGGIRRAKREHFVKYLGTVDDENVFQASKYATNREITPRFIPPLKVDEESFTQTPQEQADLFAETFNLSDSAADLDDISTAEYPDPLPKDMFPDLNPDEIKRSLFGMNPKKAAGPDSIPILALQNTWEVCGGSLCNILQACYEIGYFPAAWLTSLTWVIRKPGKPNYSLPNAYRPIALLNTMGKVFEAVIAKRLSYIAETQEMLPNCHFGGRPGRSTTDAIVSFTETVYHDWSRKRVSAALFEAGHPPGRLPHQQNHFLRLRRPCL
jgi:hypothetical protein